LRRVSPKRAKAETPRHTCESSLSGLAGQLWPYTSGVQGSMRQVLITRHGAPEVLEIREAADPVPGEGHVRIRVCASGVNFADILARLGLYPDAPKPPVVVGYEVAGYIDAVGPSVTRLRKGDRVVALTRFGGYADRIVVPEWMAFPIPAAMDANVAAAIP